MGTIQIRNVPEDVYQLYKARAAARGQSLQQYMLEWIEQLVERIKIEERLERNDFDETWYDDEDVLGPDADEDLTSLERGMRGADTDGKA